MSEEAFFDASVMRARWSAACVAAIVAPALALGCGSDDGSSAKSTADMAEAATTLAAPTAAKKRTGRVVKVVDSRFGRVLADAKGEAFYLFDKEQRGKSECYGGCATAWPPVLTKGRPRAGSGASPSKLGTTKRRNGARQVTYAGHPLYYYVQDSPGQILCQNVDEFGGLWLVVKPSGKPVR